MSFFQRVRSHNRRPIWFAAGIAFVVATAVAIAISSGDTLRYFDEKNYAGLAESLRLKHAYIAESGEITGYIAVGYPLVLAGVFELWDRPLAGKILNAVLLAAATLVLSLLVRQIFPPAIVATPYIVLGYPLLLYAAGTLYPQILGCLLVTVTCLLLCRADWTFRAPFLAGLTFGILILTIPAFLLLLPILWLFQIFTRSGLLRIALLQIAVLTCAAGLVIAPWTVRNYIQLHAFVPVSTNGGINLLLGNSALTSVTVPVDLAVLRSCSRGYLATTEIGREEGYRRCALDWIRAHPAAATRLYIAKVVNFFNFRSKFATPNQAAAWHDWIVFATYYPLLFLTVLRLAWARRYPLTRPEILIYMIYIGNTFVSALFFTRLRFRIPFDFLLIPVAGSFAMRLWLARSRDAPDVTI